jgi:YidC/Oxa1 family membrane protein insertase
MLMQFYTTILYQPLFNLLVFFYNILPDIGIAIILLTIIVKVVLWPLSHKGLKSQKALQSLQPKMEALKVKYKDDKEALGRETMALYRREKINPLASCLPLLIQLPIIIAVFRAFRAIFAETVDFSLLYSFVNVPENINPMMLGFLDLSKPQIVLAILAGLAQFWQSRIMMKKSGNIKTVDGKKKELSLPETMSKQMMYFMPIITVFIASSFPGGLALYWLLITLLGVLDQHFINKSVDKVDDNISPTPPANPHPEVVDVK